MKKNFLRMACAAMLLSTLFWSCQKENLLQEADSPDGMTLQGFASQDICGSTTTIGLADASGNLIVDYCGGPCTSSDPWGTLEYGKYGTNSPNSSLGITANLAPGWFAESYHVIVSPPGPIQTNGNLPIVNSNWTSAVLVPAQNSFEVDQPLSGSLYGASCFDWALQVQVLRFTVFGLPDPASRRDLYAYDPTGAGSPFVIDDCYDGCPAATTASTQGTCQGCRAEVTVTFHGCNSVDVSSCKDLRQVVIVYDDCSREYHDNLTGNSASYPGNGQPISHVFVRSGCRANSGNASDDLIDTNGNRYQNIRRFSFDSPCRQTNCN